MMATAFSANSGSRSFIQVSKTVQAQLMALQNDADGTLSRRTEAQLRMVSDVLSQGLNSPVRLPSPARIHFGWFLTRQDHQLSLDVGAIQTWWRTLRSIREAIKSSLREAAPPLPDDAHHQAEFVCHLLVSFASGSSENDLRAVGSLLRTGARSDSPFQLPTFVRGEHDGTPAAASVFDPLDRLSSPALFLEAGAGYWTGPPPCTHQRDQVLAVLQKTGLHECVRLRRRVSPRW